MNGSLLKADDKQWIHCGHLHHTVTGVNNKWRYLKTEKIQTAKPEQIVKCGNGTTHQAPGKDHFQLRI